MPTFDHHRLDAFGVARQALQRGDAIARRLPRGYATLSDQLRRALLSAFLGIAELRVAPVLTDSLASGVHAEKRQRQLRPSKPFRSCASRRTRTSNRCWHCSTV